MTVKNLREIYLDNAATTRPWPQVVASVENAMTVGFGNASSRHTRGLGAGRQVVRAEEAIVNMVGGGPWRVCFTSGGTEADNLAVLGSVPRGKRRTVVTSGLEHAAVEEACGRLSEIGCRVVEISAGTSGVVDPLAFEEAVDEQTALVSLVYVASEMGTVQPVGEVARRVKAKQKRCRVHVDAVQASAQCQSFSLSPEVDMVSVTAHKIHGPQGVGALLLRPSVHPRPLLFGGDQQGGIRPGTYNLAGIVGFGVAAYEYTHRRHTGVPRMKQLADHLVEELVAHVPGAFRLGDPAARAAGIVVLAFDGVESEVLLHTMEMHGVLASSSSACHAARREPPRCLVAAGLKKHQGAVRFSLSIDTTKEEIEQTIGIVQEAVASIRSGRVNHER